MTTLLVHSIAWITVILSWTLAAYLAVQWFILPKISPHYNKHLAPWLHPAIKKAFNKILTGVRDFVKSVMGW